MSDDPKDIQLATLTRELEISRQQVAQFMTERDTFHALVERLNLQCRSLQDEMLMVNGKSMQVTTALILKGGPAMFSGTGRAIWLAKESLEQARQGYTLERVAEGDEDYIEAKQEGDLLIRLRETTEEEQAMLATQNKKLARVEAERSPPPEPSATPED